MKVKIFLENGAKMPEKAHSDDFGWDVRAVSCCYNAPINGAITYGTGIHIAPILEERHKGMNICVQAFSRSSICMTGLILSNSIGIIDLGYRGEIMAKFYKVLNGKNYCVGDKIIQLALSNGEPIEWEQVYSLDDLGQTDRGCGGYGSTGR